MDRILPGNDTPQPLAESDGSPLYEAETVRMLAPAGLGQTEARLYAVLLRRPGRTVDELAAELGMAARRVRTILGGLADNGLLSQTVSHPERYLPVPPDAALEPLLARRQEDLRRARELAAELGSRVRRSGLVPGDGQTAIELLEDRETAAQRVQQLERVASAEIMIFDRPQYYSTDAMLNPGEIAALDRGVRVRAVYAHESLDYAGRIDHIRAMARHGEQARVFSSLPLKLFIFDRQTAILPDRPLDSQLAAGSVLVRTSALLDALQMFFEMVWAHATPIAVDVGQPSVAGDTLGAAEDLMSLLAAGLTDEAAARQLGISRRTLQRRVQALMESVDARSRFQAGFQVGLSLNARRAFE